MVKFDIQSLVRDYKGPKLRILMTGVGSYATGIIGIPGSSEIIDSITIPYSRESVSRLLTHTHPQFHDILESASDVSQEMVVALHMCNSEYLGDCVPLTVTGAVTTNRYRRGDNQAYIATGHPSSMEVYHLMLDKMEESEHSDADKVAQKRYLQDRMISEVALAMAAGMQSDLVDELQKAQYLVRL